MTDLPNLEFVDLYVDYLLNISIERAFSAFSAGFHLVCGADVLKVCAAKYSTVHHSPS